MITIYNIGLFTQYCHSDSVKYGYNIGSLAVKYGVTDISGFSEKEQSDIFLKIESENGGIIVVPHGGSFLRRTFIEKLLTKDGFIDDKYFNTPLYVNIQGNDVEYKIINYINNSL